MHRLLLSALLVSALLVCTFTPVGCRSRDNQAAQTSKTQAATATASAEKTALSPPAAQAAPEPSAAGDASGEPSGAEATIAAMPPAQDGAAADAAASAAAAAAAKPSGAPLEAQPTDVDRSSRTVPEPSWSTRRLVLLAPGGPRLIDLRINVGGSDLRAGFTEATQQLARHLEWDYDQPLSWEALLEKPLVQSGWLSNLVPTDEQRNELLSMYDKDNMGTVDAGEFQAFITRGLSRRDPIRVAEGRAAAPLAESTSPWGPLDRDEDGELNQEELSQTVVALMRFDFDGDGIISESELRSLAEANAGANAMSQARGLLELDAVLTVDEESPTALERAVLEHYTFADTISRDAFFHWDDRRWSELDSEASGQVTRRGLARVRELAADARFDVALPNSLAAPAGDEKSSIEGSVSCQPRGAAGQDAQAAVWAGGLQGGRLTLPGCIVLVELRDDHSWQVRRAACQQFSRALEEPQLAAALAGALDLKEGAWELLRQRGAADAGEAWGWLATSRHFHISTSWTVVEAPWFQLIDADGNRRLTGVELAEFPRAAKAWDQNRNDKLEKEELPLVVALAVARDETRLANFLMGGTIAEKGGASNSLAPSWFTGMDYNSDGGVTHAEFLGDESAFEALDANEDGIIDVREVYAPH